MEFRNGFLSLDSLRQSAPRKSAFQPFAAGAWREIWRRFGVVLPVVVNQASGHVLFMRGMVDELGVMFDAGDPPPDGVRIDGEQWFIPALAGQWDKRAEPLLTAILAGGVDFALFPAFTTDALLNVLLSIPPDDFEIVTTLGISLDDYDDLLALVAADDAGAAEPADLADGNEWGIPALLPALQVETVPGRVVKWGTVARDSQQHGALYHFYTGDKKFTGLIDKPDLLPASGCAAAAEVNFTLHQQTPAALALHRIYQKRALSLHWQECGIPLLVDMNVPPRFFTLNLLGVPLGWRAYINRAYTRDLAHLEAAYAAACERRGSDDVLYVVYGGGEKARALCAERGWHWLAEDSDVRRGRGPAS